MNNQPHLQNLINQLCPNGVEFKELGEACIIKTGQGVNKVDIDQNPGEFAVINSGRDPLGFINKYNTENDPIGITSRGAGVGSITWCEGKYFRGNLNYSATIVDKKELDVRFLFHLLLQDQSGIQQLATFQGIPALNKSSLEKLKIPIPPLFIQQEIVRILDSFTQLEAELEAELEARKKQYEFYHEKILNFDDSIETKKLNKISVIFDSLHLTPEYSDTGFPMIRVTDIKGGYINIENTLKVDNETFTTFTKRYKPQFNDIVISRVGSYGNFSLIGELQDMCLGQNTAIIHPLINAKYLYYALHSKKVAQFIENNVGGGNQKTFSLANINEIPIQVPSLPEQERIVGILDKFDALVNDISIGLPAELKARRQQYEYYRNQLLTFKSI